LTWLNLENIKLDDISALKGLTNLTGLNLKKTFLDVEQKRELKEALPYTLIDFSNK